MKTPSANPATASRTWLILATAVLFIRCLSWALAEYWYDEVLTLTHFVLNTGDRGLAAVFRSYPIANNHILNSAVYWLWVRIPFVDLSMEQMGRLPSLLFGVGMLAAAIYGWRRRLGPERANLAGLILAISPVCSAFVYQIRGYSMSLCLATVAVAAAANRSHGGKAAQWLLFLCLLLLPLAMPGNILFAAAILLYLFAETWFATRSLQPAIFTVIPGALGSLLGGGYYLTLWPAFVAASKEAGGWDSSWKVLFAVLLAILAHLGAFLLFAVFLRATSKKDSKITDNQQLIKDEDEQAVNGGQALLLIASCVTVILLSLLAFAVKGQAPFPRVYLTFLPPLTYAALLLSTRLAPAVAERFAVGALVVIAGGFLVERVAAQACDVAMDHGGHPQDLLRQYYRGSCDLRVLREFMLEKKLAEGCVVLLDEYDYPTWDFYWRLYGGNGRQSLSWNQTPADLLPRMRQSQPDLKIFAVAPDEQAAAELFVHGGLDEGVSFYEVARHGRKSLYIAPLGRGPFPPKFERPPQRPPFGQPLMPKNREV